MIKDGEGLSGALNANAGLFVRPMSRGSSIKSTNPPHINTDCRLHQYNLRRTARPIHLPIHAMNLRFKALCGYFLPIRNTLGVGLVFNTAAPRLVNTPIALGHAEHLVSTL
jgi:hypothetical protein